MKKNLFLLGSFMASSLMGANTLLVIGCQKKASAKEEKDAEKDTAIIVSEKAAELKGKITNIIDDIMSNPVDEDWMIDLDDGNSVNKAIIKKLDTAVDNLSKDGAKNQQIQLTEALPLEQEFTDKVNGKFASLKALVERKLQQSEDLGGSDFEFDFNSNSIVPMLTSLKGSQILSAVTKLKQLQSGSSSPSEKVAYASTDPVKDPVINPVINIKKLDVFNKVLIDLSYSFKFGNNSFNGEYKGVELLMAGNIPDLKKIGPYSTDIIVKFLNETEKVKNTKIYDGEDDEEMGKIKEYNYIGKQMDWDFSKPAVKDEILDMQIAQIKNLTENGALKDGLLEFVRENVTFKIDPPNYMKFSNHDLDLTRWKGEAKNTILVNKGNIEEKLNNSIIRTREEAIKNMNEQFRFGGEQVSFVKDWNGGRVNSEFFAQARKNAEQVEGKKPKINLDNYYGLGKNGESTNQLLIGYGTTTISKAKISGMALGKIEINTNLTADFNPGLVDLYDYLQDYVGTIVEAIKGQVQVGAADYEAYNLEWKYGNEGEWDFIVNEITKPENNGVLTYNWIFENVLLNKRILGNPDLYKLPTNEEFLPKESWSFLKSVTDLEYVKREDDFLKLKTTDDYRVKVPLYVKYGPFVVYLTGDDAWTYYGSQKDRGIIGKTF